MNPSVKPPSPWTAPSFASPVAQSRNSTVEDLHDIYVFGANIHRFLARHKELIGPLTDAACRINELFVRVSLRLELSDEGRRRVYIVIGTDKLPKEAVDLEERLICGWYASLLSPIQDRLAVTEEHSGF